MPLALFVQVPTYQVVNMVAMGHSLMSAISSMFVTGVVPAALVLRCAGGSIRATDGNFVVIHMVTVHIVHMTIMQIIHMSIMLNGFMTTALTMFM